MGGLLTAIAEGVGPHVAAMTPAEIALKKAQVDLTQQQIQAGALENQQRTMDMQDSALTRLYVQKHNGSVTDALADPELLRQVQPKTAIAFQQGILANQDKLADVAQKHAKATQDMAAAQKAQQEMEADQAYALQQNGYNQAATIAAIHQWANHGLMDPQTAQAALAHVDDPNALKQTIDQLAFQSPKRIADMDAQTKQREIAVKESEQNLKQSQDVRAQGAQAFGNVASQEDLNNWTETYGAQFPNAPKVYTPQAAASFSRSFVPTKDQPEYDIKTLEAKAMQNVSPKADAQLVDGVVDPNTNAALNKRVKGQITAIRTTVPDPKEQGTQIAAVLKDAADQVGAPDKAAAVERATSGIKIGTEIAGAVGKEKALAALAPPEVQGIVDTPTRNKVVTDQLAAAKDHAKATGEANQLAAYVDAASSGNQAASANVPIAALRSIVNRVNRQELEAQGGQSLARRVDDYVTKGVVGRPSAQTLADFKALSGIAQAKADGVYGDTIDSLNAQGAKYSRVAPGKYKVGETRTIGDRTVTRQADGTWK